MLKCMRGVDGCNGMVVVGQPAPDVKAFHVPRPSGHVRFRKYPEARKTRFAKGMRSSRRLGERSRFSEDSTAFSRIPS